MPDPGPPAPSGGWTRPALAAYTPSMTKGGSDTRVIVVTTLAILVIGLLIAGTILVVTGRAKNPDIKAFAKMMVKDHTATSKAIGPLATAAGQTPAAKLDDRRQGFLDNLTKASDADFDKTYVSQQVAAHEEALSLMQGYAKDGSDAGLKGAASDTAPKVQMHLDKIKGWAEDSGEGRWTVEAAIDNAVPMPAIAASLFARFVSRQDDSPAMKAIAAMRNGFGGHAVVKE